MSKTETPSPKTSVLNNKTEEVDVGALIKMVSELTTQVAVLSDEKAAIVKRQEGVPALGFGILPLYDKHAVAMYEKGCSTDGPITRADLFEALAVMMQLFIPQMWTNKDIQDIKFGKNQDQAPVKHTQDAPPLPVSNTVDIGQFIQTVMSKLAA